MGASNTKKTVKINNTVQADRFEVSQPKLTLERKYYLLTPSAPSV